MSGRVQVKVCGLRSLADVEACVRAGVDLVGFNFFPGSKRYIPPEQAAPLVAALPPSIVPVGVFVRADPRALAEACVSSGVRLAQLHGDEEPDRYASAPVPRMQVIRVAPGATLAALAPPRTELALLDARVEGFGGQGQCFDWGLAAEAQRVWGRRLFIAGGLTAHNVADAVRLARPCGVDVASGVEGAPGVKDAQAVLRFVAAVRAAEREEIHG